MYRARHVRYQRIVEKQDDYPVDGTHRSLSDEDLAQSKTAPISDLDRLRDYFRSEISEVIVVVEGIDPLMSGTFQALQSYRFDDIVWNNAASFHPCVSVDEQKDIMRVDLDRFHDVDVPTPVEAKQRARGLSLRTHDSFMTSGPVPTVCVDNGCISGASSDDRSGPSSPMRGHRTIPSLPTTVGLWERIAEEGESSVLSEPDATHPLVSSPDATHPLVSSPDGDNERQQGILDSVSTKRSGNLENNDKESDSCRCPPDGGGDSQV